MLSDSCCIERLQYFTVGGQESKRYREEEGSACLLCVSRLFNQAATVDTPERLEAACNWLDRRRETGRRRTRLVCFMIIDAGVSNSTGRKEEG